MEKYLFKTNSSSKYSVNSLSSNASFINNGGGCSVYDLVEDEDNNNEDNRNNNYNDNSDNNKSVHESTSKSLLDEKINYANKEIFANSSFRSYQRQIIDAVLANRDVFVVMPTGGGKSLCFQLPAVLTKGVTVVISPLLSLVEDQVSSLINIGIPSAYLSSTSTEVMLRQVFDDLKRGDQGLEPFLKLLYITPERMVKNLQTKDVLQSLYQNEMLARFVIDEAHCVSSWGHDFRKEYGQLGVLKSEYEDIPIVALTATARKQVADDTKKILQIQHAQEFSLGYDRPNLKFEVVIKPNKKEEANMFILEIILSYPQATTGILYCMTKAECELLSDFLRAHKVNADYYHAGMAKGAKQMVQARWLSGQVHIVCATIAYGMGIDKPDVRFVIHQSVAKSMEGYYQEAGRAGRDGLPSECILLYRQEDVSVLARIMAAPPRRKISEKDAERLEEMVAYCMEMTACRRKKFCETFSGGTVKRFVPCNDMCDNCLCRTRGKQYTRRVYTPPRPDGGACLQTKALAAKLGVVADRVAPPPRAVFATAASYMSKSSKPLSSSAPSSCSTQSSSRQTSSSQNPVSDTKFSAFFIPASNVGREESSTCNISSISTSVGQKRKEAPISSAPSIPSRGNKLLQAITDKPSKTVRKDLFFSKYSSDN